MCVRWRCSEARDPAASAIPMCGRIVRGGKLSWVWLWVWVWLWCWCWNCTLLVRVIRCAYKIVLIKCTYGMYMH